MPSIGTSIFVLAVGAILRYAVTASVQGISIATVGLILIIIGALGLVLSLIYMYAWRPRRFTAVAQGAPPAPVERVEERE